MVALSNNTQVGETPYLRDYTHASLTFRTNIYEKSPKFKYLFHTQFEINPVMDLDISTNFGVLVREIKLPSFKFDTKEFNQYNRKRLVQSKIKYEPITLSFHDDNSNIVNKLWVAYYTYYYKDGTNASVVFSGSRGNQGATSATSGPLVNYNERNQYSNSDTFSQSSDWGYYGESTTNTGNGNKKQPFFKNITVFGFHQHNFTAYTLINPIITSFGHDTFSYEEGTGVMKNTMTIDYETVVYNEGAIDGREPSNIISTFGLERDYDRLLSPNATKGSNGTALGRGGLVDSLGGFTDQLSSIANDAVQSSIDAASASYNNKINEIISTGDIALEQMLRNSASNVPVFRNVQFDFPGASTTPGPAGLAGAPTIEADVSPPFYGQEDVAGVQITA